MSGVYSCCDPCSTLPPVQVPGAPGQAGKDGVNGANGINAYTFLTSNLVVPAIGNTVTAFVGVSSWMVVGQIVVMDGPANFEVISLPGTTSALLKFVGHVGDVSPGATIASGSKVGPSGSEPPLAGTLPTALTDNTGGTASDTLAAGVAKVVLTFYCQLDNIANGTWVAPFAPGFAFKVLSIAFAVQKAVTTGAKATTLTPAINGSNVTGGALALTSANCTPQGTLVSGSAITGNDTGTNSDTLSVVASSTTAFSEGTGVIIVELQNLDTANALASLADHINTLITALT